MMRRFERWRRPVESKGGASAGRPAAGGAAPPPRGAGGGVRPSAPRAPRPALARRAAAGSLLLAWSCAACAEPRAGGPEAAGGGAEPAAACEAACARALFRTSCTSCHDAASRQGGLDLAKSPVGPRLLGAAPRHKGAGAADRCPDGGALIDPAAPGESWLLKKARREQGACGEAMPPDEPLSATDLGCLTRYVNCIAAGTPP